MNRPALMRFLKRLRYPVTYLDFETFNAAIPLFDGVKPYQHVPFRLSLHRQNSPGERPYHTSFLAQGRIDPRPEVPGTSPKRSGQKVRENLERYCGLDNEGMIWIVDELRRLCR